MHCLFCLGSNLDVLIGAVRKPIVKNETAKSRVYRCVEIMAWRGDPVSATLWIPLSIFNMVCSVHQVVSDDSWKGRRGTNTDGWMDWWIAKTTRHHLNWHAPNATLWAIQPVTMMTMLEQALYTGIVLNKKDKATMKMNQVTHCYLIFVGHLGNPQPTSSHTRFVPRPNPTSWESVTKSTE